MTDLIVPQASIRGLNMFAQPKAAVRDAWIVIVSLINSGAIKPIVAKTFPLAPTRLKHCVTWLRTALSAGSFSQYDNLAQIAEVAGALLRGGMPWAAQAFRRVYPTVLLIPCHRPPPLEEGARV